MYVNKNKQWFIYTLSFTKFSSYNIVFLDLFTALTVYNSTVKWKKLNFRQLL